MPLHYTKIFSIIALVTVVAFVLWQVWISVFDGETFEEVDFDPARAVHWANRAGKLGLMPWGRGSWSLAPAARSGSI